MWNVEREQCGIWSVEREQCGIWNVEREQCGMWSVECGVVLKAHFFPLRTIIAHCTLYIAH